MDDNIICVTGAFVYNTTAMNFGWSQFFIKQIWKAQKHAHSELANQTPH